MRPLVFITAFSLICGTAAVTPAEVENESRVYFIPQRFVQMRSEDSGTIASPRATVRAGEVRDGRIVREWKLRLPIGHTVSVQRQIVEGDETWLQLDPDSIISDRFRRHVRAKRQIGVRPATELSGSPWEVANRAPPRRPTDNRENRHRRVGLENHAEFDSDESVDAVLAAALSDDSAAIGSGVALAGYLEDMPDPPAIVETPPIDPLSTPYDPRLSNHNYDPNGPIGPGGRSAGCQTPYAPYAVPPRGPARGPIGRPYPNQYGAIVSLPPMMGGFFDNSNLNVDVTTQHSFDVAGQIANPSGPILIFERDGVGVFNDLVSIPGTGRDASGDGIDDTFDISEPLPPNDVPTAPTANSRFAGGTVTYTGGAGTNAINGQFVNNEIWRAQYGFIDTIAMVAPGSVQRTIASDNNSPVPRDRIHFDYNFFDDATVGFGGVHRYTFGIEKTFLNDWLSIDARLPFAGAWESARYEGDTNVRATNFGDVSLFTKMRVFETPTSFLSAGVGVGLPSGPDSRLFRADGTQVVWIRNESIHLIPFVSGVWAPSPYFYLQSFLQVDVDTRGNSVAANATGGRLPSIGKLKDTTMLNVDLGGGYWLIKSVDQRRLLRGLAVIMELNYATSLQDADSVNGNGIRITDVANRLDVFNIAAGIHSQFGDSLALTTGVTLPLKSGFDARADWQLSSLVSWLF